MSNERLDRLEEIVETNTLATRQLNESINYLVSEFIRPNTQQAFANYERLERLESALETLVAQSLVNAEQIAANPERIAANQEQIAGNTENITRLEAMIEGLGTRIADQSNQIQVLIDEGRVDRQNQREALAAILAVSGRVDVLEQRAS